MGVSKRTKEKLTLWVEDLERGGHLQTGGQLHGIEADRCTHRYCCLGRLAEVAIADGVNMVVTTRDERSLPGSPEGLPVRTAVGYDGEFGFVPERVYEWLDMSESHTRAFFTYAKMNDRGYRFPEIAEQVRADFGLAEREA